MPDRRRSAKAAPDGLRDPIVANVFLRHILHIIGTLHGLEQGYVLEGDQREGRFFTADGCGNHHVLAWSPAGVVAMAFDHEGADIADPGGDPEALLPERMFDGAPANVVELVQRVTSWRLAQRLGNSARWVSVGDGGEDAGRGGNRGDQLDGYLGSAEEALDGRPGKQGWRELLSVSAAQGRVATRLSRERRPITPEEGSELLTSLSDPDSDDPDAQEPVVPTPANAEAAVRLLQAIGIEWPDGVESANRLFHADPDQGFALIDAVQRSDLEAAGALLRAGANIHKKSRPGQLPGALWADGGATPLITALSNKDLPMSKLLLESGADPSRACGPYTPLTVAAMAGSRPLCELLLERGADLSPVRDSIYFAAIDGKNVDVVELFAGLGVAMGMSRYWQEKLDAIRKAAGRSGPLGT